MRTTIRRLALAAMLLAPFVATPAFAQPTPEGTVITNTATATWTDANGNSYTPVNASVSVTVGFLAGPDVTSAPSVTPSSPSAGNNLGFTITNTGNGVDSVSVATTAGAGVTITGYVLGGVTYPTIGDLNEALAGTAIPQGGSVTVTVIYTVAPGQGGQTIPVELTATSRRTPGTSDASTTNVNPAVSAGVNVTPDNGTQQRLPSNGTTYTAVFTVANTGNASDTYGVAAGASNGNVTIVSVGGTPGTSGSVTVAAGGSTTVTVVYTVANGAPAGATVDIGLTATSGSSAATSDAGSYTVTVIRAAISMTKEAFRDNQTTVIGASDRVLPGEFIQYRITVTNTGTAAATLTGTGYGITDALPGQVTYVSSAGDAAGWAITESAGTVSAALTGTLAPAASRHFWIRVQVQ